MGFRRKTLELVEKALGISAPDTGVETIIRKKKEKFKPLGIDQDEIHKKKKKRSKVIISDEFKSSNYASPFREG